MRLQMLMGMSDPPIRSACFRLGQGWQESRRTACLGGIHTVLTFFLPTLFLSSWEAVSGRSGPGSRIDLTRAFVVFVCFVDGICLGFGRRPGWVSFVATIPFWSRD